jgi:Skp family chaperone for outer membrane proteins
MFKKILGVCFAFLLASSAIGSETAGRVALVIGNAAYKSSPLANPVNDAQDMAKSLRALGFDVVERTNITSKQIGRTLRAFRTKIKPGDVALVFYAGHGLQINGENYLPAVDADIVGEEDVPNQSLSTRQIMDVLAESKSSMNLVFLDACRDNPYARSFRSATRGLSRENAPSGTLISYATRPGSVAADGTGRNGLYTSVLLKAMEETNQPIEQVLKQVVRGVTAASNGAQEPWMEGSVTGDFCFGKCYLLGAAPNIKFENEIKQRLKEDQLWEQVKISDALSSIEKYILDYPNGRYSNLARDRLNQKIEDQLWEQAKISDDINVIENYIEKYPNGRFLNKANNRKNQINEAMKFSGKYGYIDSERALSLLGPHPFKVLSGETSSTVQLSEINARIPEFAKKYNIKLILQNVVFSDEKSDVTEIFVDYYKSNTIDYKKINQLPNLYPFLIKFVNAGDVLTNSKMAILAQENLKGEFQQREKDLSGFFSKLNPKHEEMKAKFETDLAARKNEELQRIVKAVNVVVKELAAARGIDLILQDAVYASPEFDITQEVIQLTDTKLSRSN